MQGKYKTIKLNQPKIDSFTLNIKLLDCEIYDERLTSLTSTYYHSLDQYETEPNPPKPFTHSENGLTTRISLNNFLVFNPSTNLKETTQFIKLVITTKFLKSNYFDGINSSNIYELYLQFINLGIFYTSFETFIQSQVNDIDICQDTCVNKLQTFSDAIDSIYQQSQSKFKYLNRFKNKNEYNTGMDMNSRHKATPSLPYIKLYHKEIELLTRSTEFYELYLRQHFNKSDIKNLVRVEATIRNSRHKKRLSNNNILPDFKTLQELLQIETTQLYKFLQYSVSSYVETKPRIKNPNLSPSEHIMFQLIQSLVLNGYDYFTILQQTIETYKGSSKATTQMQKSRMKLQITKLYDLLIHKDIKIQEISDQNQEVNNYLKSIGLNPL